MKFIRHLIVNLITAAAVIIALSMLTVAYSDRVHPTTFHYIGCLGMTLPLFVAMNILSLLVLLTVKWKRAWIPLAGFVLAYVPIRTFLPLNIDREPPEGCIKLITYNVCGYTGNGKYDNGLDTVTTYITAFDADIVCLQEDMSVKAKPLERWQELYPYNDTVHVSSNEKYVNAIGIHTRYPILKKERIEYESETNGSMAYFLLVGSDTVIVVNNHMESTHLTVNDRKRYKEVIDGNTDKKTVKEDAHLLIGKLSDGMALRAPQAEAVHQFVESHMQYPIIVCGDFNDTPISYVRHTMAKGMTDCFMERGCGPGLSYNQKGFHFRIDHIFCSPQLTPYKCIVDSKMDASDHYPMLCWLKMTDKP